MALIEPAFFIQWGNTLSNQTNQQRETSKQCKARLHLLSDAYVLGLFKVQYLLKNFSYATPKQINFSEVVRCLPFSLIRCSMSCKALWKSSHIFVHVFNSWWHIWGGVERFFIHTHFPNIDKMMKHIYIYIAIFWNPFLVRPKTIHQPCHIWGFSQHYLPTPN